MAERAARKVGIACQGGGSHAAFTAGVLRRLMQKDLLERYELAGISGTSGGAICAALAWTGLKQGGPQEARERLYRFWDHAKADTPLDAWQNYWGQAIASLPWRLDVSPYRVESGADRVLGSWLREFLKLEELTKEARAGAPYLFIGATDVLKGDRCIFSGTDLDYPELLGSAALPFLYRAVHTRGHVLWDGLFSVNPPIRDLLDLDLDELWVIQISPLAVAQEPKTFEAIRDRRDQLAGNISLAQELHFVDKINEIVALNGELKRRRRRGEPQHYYRPVTIRLLDAGLDEAKYGYGSTLDRSPELIDELIRRGEAMASRFFDEETLWPRRGALEGRTMSVAPRRRARRKPAPEPDGGI
ncbi:patatin-like phospholipase family protein [Ancylobacter sp. MQZ15Z-1]|uniref:Patatin-like phospholipase family protein n=1 Tax=Ancylobacter mangrovi TaxID=2972472 RepID=A0A9X2PHR9_9HYPH|nr:patatin-like phospholipase family protein [Ancylobacter mangrovi]MCS0496350.1 patatin-like phospholipase family protein [Ancylobacter mangrovi]